MNVPVHGERLKRLVEHDIPNCLNFSLLLLFIAYTIKEMGYDPTKWQVNLNKHNIDLAECEAVFDNPMPTQEDTSEPTPQTDMPYDVNDEVAVQAFWDDAVAHKGFEEYCSGLMLPDTLLRDTTSQLMRCHDESKKNV